MNFSSASLKHQLEIDHSSIHSHRSRNQQIREIDSFYFRSKESDKDQLKDSSRSIGLQDSKKDSLKFSNTPSRQESDQKHQDLISKSMMVQQYTPQGLIDELKKKHPLRDDIGEFLIEHRSWVPRPPFSAIPLWNPAFKRLEEVKREIKRRFESRQGWLDQKEQLQEPFYMVPQDMLQIITESTGDRNKQQLMISQQIHQHDKDRSLVQISQRSEYSRTQNLSQTKGKQPDTIKLLGNHQSLQNNVSQQFRSFIKQLTSFKAEDKQQPLQIKEVSRIKMSANQQSDSCQANQSHIHTSNFSPEMNSMSHDQLTQQIIKHLKILEELNNSLTSQVFQPQRESPQKTSKDVQCDFINQIPCKAQHQVQIDNQSQYLKSSAENLPLSLSQKKNILKKFNQDQICMMKKMIDSMVLFKEIGQIRETESRLKLNSQSDQFSNQDRVNHNKNKKIAYKSNIESLNNLRLGREDTSISQNCQTSPTPGSNECQNSTEFKKLEILMKDRQMKQSIIVSREVQSSFNTSSLLQLVERQMM